jgi:uncharacterized protein YyaL (SSP411 family)
VATRAADAVLSRLLVDGKLRHELAGGTVRGDGDLDDHAFLVAGLLDLLEATGEPRWMRAAVSLDDALARRFEDRAGGGFFRTAEDAERLLARDKPGFDGAEPSGNSVEAMNLLRLAALTGDDRHRDRADRTLRAFSTRISRAPLALKRMLVALDARLARMKEVVIATATDGGTDAEPLLAPLRRGFHPYRVVVVKPPGASALDDAVPIARGKVPQHGRAAAYVCEHGACRLPTSDPTELARQLDATE